MDINNKINLQEKTKALSGIIECYWFENINIGLTKTLFHRIIIPLAQFDSGLDYLEQPIQTSIFFDFYNLNLKNHLDIDGFDLNHLIYTDAEASVYIGSAHNWCDVKKLVLEHIEKKIYKITGELYIEFENENVAKNEFFNFTTTATFKTKIDNFVELKHPSKIVSIFRIIRKWFSKTF